MRGARGDQRIDDGASRQRGSGRGHLTVSEPVCHHADVALLGCCSERRHEVGDSELHGGECN
jgi:hypothetical protein